MGNGYENKNTRFKQKMDLVQLVMADCETTGDIQTKLKGLFAGVIEQMLERKWTMPLRDWGPAYPRFAIWFEDRLSA